MWAAMMSQVHRSRYAVLRPAARTGSLAQVDTATQSLLRDPISVGSVPHGGTVSADGRRAWVTVASSSQATVDC